jgi:hypothetical protein
MSEKENTQRNRWTYRRGTVLGPNNQANGKFKKANNRAHRSQVRTKLQKGEFDFISTQRHHSMYDAWSSPKDMDITERYRPKHKLNIRWVPWNYQSGICERGVIQAYKHKQRKFPVREIEERAGMKRNKPEFNPWTILPFVQNLFEDEDEYLLS